MTIHFNNGFPVVGIEAELDGISATRSERVLSDANINDVWVTTDPSNGVSAEIVFPPLDPYNPATWTHVRSVLDTLDNNGGRISQGCGMHVHFSSACVTSMSSNDYNDLSREKASQTSYNSPSSDKYVSGDVFGDLMPFELLKDVVYRYGLHQPEINKLLAGSRHNNRMCNGLYNTVRHTNFESITDPSSLNDHIGGKFYAINVSNFGSGKQTIEFRQHQGTLNADKIRNWVMLISNMFYWSASKRLFRVNPIITEQQPFRANTRNGVAWLMCRTENGATVQEMMDAIGWSPNNVRRTMSEWRSRFGDDIVVTVSQQNNGSSYGSGDTYTRYIVRESTGGTIELFPENQIGHTSIYAGLEDQIYEYLQDRIIELGH